MLYQQRYRVETCRLPNWDYRSVGYYFVTICAGNRWTRPFGYVQNGIMCLSDIGTMAYKFWLDIPHHFPNASLDKFVIMPDHVHGIIIIHPNNVERHDIDMRHGRDAINRVSTFDDYIKPVQIGGITNMNNPMLYRSSLPTMIRWYKGIITYHIHKINHPFQWQSRYYDRIIRTQQELHNVRGYIINNPKNLKKTKN